MPDMALPFRILVAAQCAVLDTDGLAGISSCEVVQIAVGLIGDLSKDACCIYTDRRSFAQSISGELDLCAQGELFDLYFALQSQTVTCGYSNCAFDGAIDEIGVSGIATEGSKSDFALYGAALQEQVALALSILGAVGKYRNAVTTVDDNTLINADAATGAVEGHYRVLRICVFCLSIGAAVEVQSVNGVSVTLPNSSAFLGVGGVAGNDTVAKHVKHTAVAEDAGGSGGGDIVVVQIQAGHQTAFRATEETHYGTVIIGQILCQVGKTSPDIMALSISSPLLSTTTMVST